LAVLADAYREDVVNDETRVYLAFSSNVAPVKAAIFPLLKNKPELVKKAEEVFTKLKKELPQIMFDDNGNIGKRYRRQDEIGTPYCITVDFDTLTDNMVTIRERDSGKQERVAISDILSKIKG
jgi:glycyl-tRNA synthetase